MSDTMTSNQAKLKSLALANNHLAVKLHRLLAEGNGNVFFSPFSISTTMAMLLCAAAGETESELRKVLGYDDIALKKDEIALTFQQQMALILKDSDCYQLSSANSMIIQKDFIIKDEYKKILSESFKALILDVDFRKEIEKAIIHINKWVQQKTNNMITVLVETFDPDTIMILLNAVYFKGTWLKQFEKERTSPQEFYNKGSEDNVKQVDMMHLTDTFSLYEDTSMQVLELPYIGEDISMLILLPRKKDGLESVEAHLTPSFFEEFKEKLKKKKVKVWLPKFRLECTKSLSPCFHQLGARRIFSVGAELNVASDSPNLAVSEILHKAVLEVNEEGSEAAAVTKITIRCKRMIINPVFLANHPFVLVIYDTRSDIILFMGRVDEL